MGRVHTVASLSCGCIAMAENGPGGWRYWIRRSGCDRRHTLLETMVREWTKGRTAILQERCDRVWKKRPSPHG